MKKNRITALCAITAVAVLNLTMTSFAAGWQQNTTGWWWQNDDATWPAASWKWIDGNSDGIAECYYFNGDGYMLANTMTPDGYLVDPDGRWVVDGVVQTKVIGSVNSHSSGSSAGGSAGRSDSSGSGATNSTNENINSTKITGRYDLTSSGDPLISAYDTPIDKTNITAINDPDKFCELMNLGELETPENVQKFYNSWRVDKDKPVVESGYSNIYYDPNSLPGDSRDYMGGEYMITKVSKGRPYQAFQGNTVYEVRVYCFENGYLLVNTTRNGIYFNERGEAVVNGVVVRHTNYCYYGDKHWDTTLAQKNDLIWDYDPLTYEGYPIFYHNNYMGHDGMDINGYGFGDCCAAIYDYED